MYESHTKAIRHSLTVAQEKQIRAQLGQRMLEIFFADFPETTHYFAQSDVESFAQLKFKYVSDFILDSVSNPEYALYYFVSEVYRHDYHEVRDPIYFNRMLEACQQTVLEALGDQLNPELTEYWNESIQTAKATLQEARRKAGF